MDMIDVEAIEAALNDEDVEGLLEMGAPSDEYHPEAGMIAAALANCPKPDRTEDRVVAIVSAVYGTMFGRSGLELERKQPAFRRIAQRIISQSNWGTT